MLLSLVLMITVAVPDVGAARRAYSGWLDYEVVEQGRVPRELAAVWSAGRMAGREYVLLQPASHEPVYLRLVQVDAVPGYVPMATTGWNAIEMLVQDPDALAGRLGAPTSPFRIVGPPRPLGPNSPIRAMQVVGPAGEVLYLTRIPADSPSGMAARTAVDRPFILIVGHTDFEALRAFYARFFDLTSSAPVMARMTVLNRAQGLDPETAHPLSMARLSPRFAFELDGYPTTAGPRATRAGELPPAVAMVTALAHGDAGERSLVWLAPPRRIRAQPYAGREVGVVRGPGGELLEIVRE